MASPNIPNRVSWAEDDNLSQGVAKLPSVRLATRFLPGGVYAVLLFKC
jgi:hypothetical protein